MFNYQNVYDSDFVETDASPLTTQTLRYFEELRVKNSFSARYGSRLWETFCELNASEPECKVYED